MSRAASLLLFLCALGAASEAPPVPEPVAEESPTVAPSPVPELNRLLRVPKEAVEAQEVRGGKDRAAWQAQFARAREEVRSLEGRIRETQEKLRDAASQEWSFSPTGGEIGDPEILALRATLRRDRESLEAARNRLREMQVEASLAGVPESWQQP